MEVAPEVVLEVAPVVVPDVAPVVVPGVAPEVTPVVAETAPVGTSDTPVVTEGPPAVPDVASFLTEAPPPSLRSEGIHPAVEVPKFLRVLVNLGSVNNGKTNKMDTAKTNPFIIS